MEQTATLNRRACERRDYDRPCKLARHGAARFAAGRTINLSSSGALLEVEEPVNVEPGQIVEVGIQWCRGGLMRQAALIPSRIVRMHCSPEGTRHIAVQFVSPKSRSRERSM